MFDFILLYQQNIHEYYWIFKKGDYFEISKNR